MPKIPQPQPRTPQEFQQALIATLEAIQQEIGIVVEAVKFQSEGAKTTKVPPIVYPLPGKMCTQLQRVTPAPRTPRAAGTGRKPTS